MKKPKAMQSPIFVELPKKSPSVYISVLFSYGYYSESENNFGLGHLLEHYLGFRIDEKIGRPIESASISNRVLQFDIKTTQQKLVKDLSDVLTVLETDPINNGPSLEREKARIKIEVDEMYARTEMFLDKQALNCLYAGPNIVTRSRTLQNQHVAKAKFEDLRTLRDTLFSRHFSGVVIGAYKLPRATRTEVELLLKKYVVKAKSFEQAPKPIAKIAKTKTHAVTHHGIEPDYAHVSIQWPALSLKNRSADRFALRFICSQLYEKLRMPLGDIGIYRFDYQYVLANAYGYVRFYGYIPKNSSAQFEKALYQRLQTISKDRKGLEENLKKFVIPRTKSLKETWNDNLERMEWVIDDLIDYGEIVSFPEVVSQRKKMNTALVLRLIRAVFQKRTQHSLIVTSSRI